MLNLFSLADINFTLSKDFNRQYWLFIRKKTADLLPKRNKILFRGRIENIYVIIADDTKDHNRLLFTFGNINTEKVFTLDVLQNQDGYFYFYIKAFCSLPKVFRDILLKRSLIFKEDNNVNITSVQRLIASCVYDLKKKQVHHIDRINTNNEFSNLIPLEPDFHYWLHSEDYHLKGEPYINFEKKKNDLLKNQRLFKRNNYKRYNNDKTLYALCYLRYKRNITLKNLLTYNKDAKKINIPFPQSRTIRSYISLYPEFNNWHVSITT
jgi:hypothetical protein